jgi:RNA polymerase sigma-70 factor, ECF subfamily
MPFDWEQFYKNKAPELILYGRALGLDHGEAEDVLHETFMALMRLDELPQQPEHYCLRSFRNRALNHKRSLWRRLKREIENPFFGGSDHWFEASPDDDEQRLQSAAVQRLSEIPMEQREVIVLKIWHGCTFDEIGGLLGIPPNTAAGRYRYGLQKIRNQLATGQHEFPGCESTGCPMFSQDVSTI